MRPLNEATPEELEGWPLADRVRRLEENDRTTVVERRRITRLQRSQLRGVGAAIVLIVVVAAVLGRGISHTSQRAITNASAALKAQVKAHEAQVALREYQIASCKRGNERTAADNRARLDNYRFDVGTVGLLHLALALPQRPNPAVTPAERRHVLDATRAYIASLESAAAHQAWHHLIEDCVYAVDHPSTYRLPGPVRFSKHLPPAGTLHVRRGE